MSHMRLIWHRLLPSLRNPTQAGENSWVPFQHQSTQLCLLSSYYPWDQIFSLLIQTQQLSHPN